MRVERVRETRGGKRVGKEKCLDQAVTPAENDGSNAVREHEAQETPPPVQSCFIISISRYMDVHSMK